MSLGLFKIVEVASTPNIDNDPAKIFQAQASKSVSGIVAKPTSEQEQFQIAVDRLLNKNQ